MANSELHQLRQQELKTALDLLVQIRNRAITINDKEIAVWSDKAVAALQGLGLLPYPNE